jgi:hypothetical protein
MLIYLIVPLADLIDEGHLHVHCGVGMSTLRQDRG